jgi:hypothetical protein
MSSKREKIDYFRNIYVRANLLIQVFIAQVLKEQTNRKKCAQCKQKKLLQYTVIVVLCTHYNVYFVMNSLVKNAMVISYTFHE